MGSRKRVLLTGGTGNMGREAIKRLMQVQDLDLRLMIRPEERRDPLVRSIERRSSVEIAWGDLKDPASVRDAVTKCDVVLHVGGLVSPLADNLPAELVSNVNIGGAEAIVRGIIDSGGRDHVRLVYIGTVAQTGSRNAPVHWGRTGDPIKISSFDHYALTKTRAEAIVAQSGIRHWVSLRQSGMAHYDLWRLFDPIMFHNPINGVFEWSTANDSGRLMAAVCSDNVPASFWRNFYNIGGGASSRVVNHEFMARSMPNYADILRPHWFATRNFHGQWYADSDRLEELVPFREQSLDGFLTEYRKRMPWPVRLAPRIAPSLIRKRVETLARGPGGSLHWFEHDERSKIEAYFGSRDAWMRLPRRWDEFTLTQPSREPRLLEHGYDERKSPEQWDASDLRQAASFRGGSCVSGATVHPDDLAEWRCAEGHNFQMTPRLALRGGHWCPECMADTVGYVAQARRNPFLAQVCKEETHAFAQ